MQNEIDHSRAKPVATRAAMLGYLDLLIARKSKNHRCTWRCQPMDGHKGECNAVFADMVVDVRALREVQYWRLFPYGYWTETDGSLVIFDRNYCPLLRLHVERGLEVPHPLERIQFCATGYYYGDGCAPYIDPDTLPLILCLADAYGLGPELDYRWKLSDHGRTPMEIWCPKWQPNE